MTFSFVGHIVKGNLKQDFLFLRVLRKRWHWVIPLTLVCLCLTVGVFLWLYDAVPILRWSWLSLLPETANGEKASGNLLVQGLRIPYFVYIFWALLVLNIPRLAMAEEEEFRRGVRTWPKMILMSIYFGIAHCIVGIPIAAGLALSISGVWFGLVYWRGGVRLSASAHAIHNWVLMLLFLILTLQPLLFG